MNKYIHIIFSILYLIVIVGMLIPTIMTVLPHEASKPNYFGYKSYCAFAPWSTLSMAAIILLLISIIYAVQVLVAR